MIHDLVEFKVGESWFLNGLMSAVKKKKNTKKFGRLGTAAWADSFQI